LAPINDDVLASDYVHGVFETIKIRGVTKKNATWNYRAKVKLNKKLEGSYNDELKL